MYGKCTCQCCKKREDESAAVWKVAGNWQKEYDSLLPEVEQLRAQLAERDKEIERLEGEQIVGGIARHHQLMRELSQAKETINDFRSALELTCASLRVGTTAHNITRQALQKHPDSTEVKG